MMKNTFCTSRKRLLRMMSAAFLISVGSLCFSASKATASPCSRAHDYMIMRSTHADMLALMESGDFSQKYGVSVTHGLIPDKPVSITLVNGVIVTDMIDNERDDNSAESPETLDAGHSLYGASKGTAYEVRAMPNDIVDLILFDGKTHYQVAPPSAGGWIAIVNDVAIAGVAVDGVCD